MKALTQTLFPAILVTLLLHTSVVAQDKGEDPGTGQWVSAQKCRVEAYGFEVAAPKGMLVFWQDVKDRIASQGYANQAVCALRNVSDTIRAGFSVWSVFGDEIPGTLRAMKKQGGELLERFMGDLVEGSSYKDLESEFEEPVTIDSIEGVRECFTFERHWKYQTVPRRVCAATVKNGAYVYWVYVSARGFKANEAQIDTTLGDVLKGMRLFPPPQ